MARYWFLWSSYYSGVTLCIPCRDDETEESANEESEKEETAETKEKGK